MSEIIEIHGTTYEVHPNEHGQGDVTEILGTRYEIHCDSEGQFSFCRIDSDGGRGIESDSILKSKRAAIEVAEIHERMVIFLLNTNHPIDVLEDCVQVLKEFPPFMPPTDG